MDPRSNPDLRQVFNAVESIAVLVSNFEHVANAPMPLTDPNAGPRTMAARQAMVRVTAGATTGATIAAMSARDKNALVTGAIIGGIAGFIYDRAMYSAAQQRQYAPPPPACPVPVQP
jgi:uncharacterized membrane protein